ncbi:MAG: competence/damage-inducible protein A [Bacteroidales bacterium]|nr:competence/damage-inducible protein A [Bacteroidales bacterium]MCF8457345.1 competence/damage-inducible protein A [Bacteroidales bacterium]
MKKAEIITIGDEILIGQIVDTNSAWMAQKLNEIGIQVVQISSISDDKQHIIAALDEAQQRADIILISGGLGPTNDDITKLTLAEYFNSTLIENKEALDKIKDMLDKRGIAISKINRDQALVPHNCTPISNYYGTAMGMWFEKSGKIIISMPGVPFEMKGIMEREIIPRLSKLAGDFHIVHKTLLVLGYPESILAQTISSWEDNLPEGLKLAYLPSPGKVRLRLSMTGRDEVFILKTLSEEIEKLEKIIPDAIVNDDEAPIQESLGNLLRQAGKTISTAESCTGGKIAHYITSVPGSSDYFKGSIIAYSNETKENILGIKHESLLKYGAVSKAVVEEMAVGARLLLKTDYAVATSGIAGPGGGTEEKPVGTTWIAVSSSKQLVSEKFIMGDHRERNIEKATITALDMVRKIIESENDAKYNE